MKSEGLSYRRQAMLSDWRTVNELEKKEGTMRYVRKDYRPTTSAYAKVEWKMSKEYMYKVKVFSRLSPDKPITERFVNIMSDQPLTPHQVENEVSESWGKWETYGGETLVRQEVWTAVQRVIP